MLSVTWTNPAGGDWDTPGNWSTDSLPGPSDDVIINMAGIAITHASTATDTIASLSNDAALTLSGGSLVVSGQLSGPGVLTLSGGRISGATVASGTSVDVANAGGTLNAVTLDGTLDINGTGAPTVTVTGGLTLGGGNVIFEAGSYGIVRFTDTQASLAGTGTVTFNNGGNSVYNTLQEDVAGGTLTIGPGVTISGGSGAIGYDPSIGGPSNVAFINRGTIDADSAGTITLNGTGWTNDGTIESSGGGNLNLYGAGWTNSGTVTAGGGTLNLGNAAWSNAGTISAANATTNLGGTFTQADLGSFSRTGGAVNLTGTQTNTGATLALTATTGSWNLAGGTIDGGTVTATGGALLEATNQGGKLKDGVTLLGDPSMTDAVVLDMASSNPVVTVAGGAAHALQRHDLPRGHQLRHPPVHRRPGIAGRHGHGDLQQRRQ